MKQTRKRPTTRRILDCALIAALNNRPVETAFMRAVLKAVEGIPLKESKVPQYRREWAKFCQKVGKSGEGNHATLPRCCDWRPWTGRWNITQRDLLFLRSVAMWVGRYDAAGETMADTFWDSMLCERAHHKRMWQAWLRFKKTGLTREHLALIAHNRWYQNCWRGDGESIYMDGKHPWGDSFKELSIYERAGWKLPRNKAGEVEMTRAQEERAWNLFDELPFAIPAAANRLLKRRRIIP